MVRQYQPGKERWMREKRRTPHAPPSVPPPRPPPHHEHKVRHGGAVHGAASAGPHDYGDLRDDARGVHVALEDLRVAREGVDALLDAGTAGGGTARSSVSGGDVLA
jgi:hypothetical protein